IGVVTMVLGARLIESDQGIGLGAGADVLGAALVTVALMLGVYTIVESGTYGLSSLHTLGLGAVAIGLLAAFVIRQAVARAPILPLRLFRSRNLAGANLIQALMVGAFFGFFFLGALDLQRVLRYGPMAIGLAFLPDTVAMAALSIGLSARLITRFGSRTVVLAGLTFIATGLVLFALSPVNADYVRDLLLPMALLGVGAGLSFPALTILAMSGATPSDAGLASGLLNTTTQVGAALGLAILATLATSRTGQLITAGQGAAAALSGGYHFVWASSAGLVIATIVLAATLLKSEPERAAATDNSMTDSAMEEAEDALEKEEVCA
ncbi:MAG: MFS transporter, partial [Ktedonobacterales bacterium]